MSSGALAAGEPKAEPISRTFPRRGGARPAPVADPVLLLTTSLPPSMVVPPV
jgi:hypothetical protein